MIRSIHKFSKEEISRINRICLKLENTVNQIDVINWLGNFTEDDWEKALIVSERIKYFTKSAIISELDIFLLKILNSYPGKTINVAFLGEFGKSGSHLMYYIKKTPTYKNNISRLKILEHLKKIHVTVKNNGILLLVDDFIGTGESASKFFNYEIKQQLVRRNINIKTIFLCVAYMEDAKNYLDKNIEDYIIVGTPYRKAFSNLGSVFGYRKKMIAIRNFCYHYGQNLFSVLDIKTGIKTHHPLGYGDSQSLIIFSHSTPNNSLPIIWSTKKSWAPLFIRSVENEISKYRDFRKSTVYWMIIAVELKIISDISQFKTLHFRDLNYRILALTRLKMKNISDPIICQILNITLNDLEGIYNDGLIMGYFDENKSVTEMGRQNYLNILRELKKNKKEKKNSLDLVEEKIYVPKQFLGRS